MGKNNSDFLKMDQSSKSGGLSNRAVIEMILGLLGVGFLFFFLPAVLLAILLTYLLKNFSKKCWEWWGFLGFSFFLFLYLTNYSWLPLFQFGGLWRTIWADGVRFAEEMIQNGAPFVITAKSWLGIGILTGCFTCLFLLGYRGLEKTWFTKEKEAEKKDYLTSDRFKKIFRDRGKILAQRQRAYRRSSNKKVYLGMNTKAKDIFLDIHSFFTHCFICGTTGSGKTSLMYNILEGALRNGLGTAFIDGKGDPKTEKEVRKIAEFYGKKVYVFSDRTDFHYNPVRYGKATAIKDRLMATLDWSESFYEKESENMLQMIIRFVQDFAEKEELEEQNGVVRPKEQGERLRRDLQTIHRFLDMEELANYLFIEQKRTEKKEPIQEQKKVSELVDQQKKVIQSKTFGKDLLYAKYNQYFFGKSSLTYGDIEAAAEMKGEKIKLIQGLRTQLELLIYSDLGEKFLENEVPEKNLDLFKIIREGHVVLFSFNSNDYSGFIKTLGRFLIADVAHVVTKLYAETEMTKTEQIKSTSSIYQGGIGFFDEFGSYASKKIIDIVSKARSADFGAVLGAQSQSDLKTEEGDLTGRIIDNVNLFLLGRVNDPDNAEYTSRLAGTYEDIDRTVMTENKGGIFRRIETKEDRGTIRNVRKFIFDPDTAKELPNHTFFMVDKTGNNLSMTKEQIYSRNALDGLK
ncbi:hypothetical protein IGK80_001133 [Enterococcus sp. DIV0609]|uniref:type IV secretory system conjugative DNA transfer family protein n=1 Tax=unclassified Enterococcus TaxID=2608891 RepID=UPI003F24CF6B